MYGWPDFTVGGALRRTVDILRHQAGTLLALSALLYAVPVSVFNLLPRLGLIPSPAAIGAAAAAGQPVPPSATVALIVFGLASIAVVFLGSMLATAAIVWVAHENLHGRRTGFGGGTARAFRVLPANVVMIVLYTLGVVAASVLLVVPGVMLLLRWSAALPVLVVERAGILGSLGRSRDLTRGHRWAILGFFVLVALVNALVFGVAGIGGALAGKAIGGPGGTAFTAIAGFLVNAFVSVVNGAVQAALYFELRRAGEGALSAEAAEAFT